MNRVKECFGLGFQILKLSAIAFMIVNAVVSWF